VEVTLQFLRGSVQVHRHISPNVLGSRMAASSHSVLGARIFLTESGKGIVVQRRDPRRFEESLGRCSCILENLLISIVFLLFR
jgi:hypothetical protein